MEAQITDLADDSIRTVRRDPETGHIELRHSVHGKLDQNDQKALHEATRLSAELRAQALHSLGSWHTLGRAVAYSVWKPHTDDEQSQARRALFERFSEHDAAGKAERALAILERRDRTAERKLRAAARAIRERLGTEPEIHGPRSYRTRDESLMKGLAEAKTPDQLAEALLGSYADQPRRR